MRTDSLMLGGLRMAQIVSVGMFAVGLFFFIRRFRSGRFDNLYNQDVVYQQDSQSSDKRSILGNKPNKKNLTKTKSSPKETKPQEVKPVESTEVMPNILVLPKNNVVVNPNISDSIPLGPQPGNVPKKRPDLMAPPATPQQALVPQEQQQPKQKAVLKQPLINTQPAVTAQPAMPQQPLVQQQPVMAQQPQLVPQQPVMPQQPFVQQQPMMPQQPAIPQQPAVQQLPPLGSVTPGMLGGGDGFDLPLINQNPTNNGNNNPQGPSITGF
jgi:nitrogen fixation-related uncharacterized protein